jgi:hypothetical protein
MKPRGKRTTLPAKYEPGFIRELDGRYALAQRLTTAFEEVVADCGGVESLTHVQLSMIERFCFLEAQLQNWEAEIARHPKESEHLVSRWVQATNALQGLAKVVGLERRLPNTLTLKAYVKEREA